MNINVQNQRAETPFLRLIRSTLLSSFFIYFSKTYSNFSRVYCIQLLKII